MEMNMGQAVDMVLTGVEHLSQTFAMAKQVTGEQIDPLVFASATVVAWTACVSASAPQEVVESVSEASADLTAILVHAVNQRARDEGEAFKSFGLD